MLTNQCREIVLVDVVHVTVVHPQMMSASLIIVKNTPTGVKIAVNASLLMNLEAMQMLKMKTLMDLMILVCSRSTTPTGTHGRWSKKNNKLLKSISSNGKAPCDPNTNTYCAHSMLKL